MSGSASGTPSMGGKGGGTVATPNPTAPVVNPAATAPAYVPAPAPTYAQPAGQNVYAQAAGAYNQALQGTAAAGMSGAAPQQAQAYGYNPTMAGYTGYNAAMMGQAPQIAGTNLSAYMNPYTQNVINRSMSDIGTAQQLAMGQLGSQATAAKAFGGSRHGIAEGATNAGFIKQMADTSAGLNQQNFQNAQGMAQSDISTQMAQMQANQNALNNSSAFGAGAYNNMSQANAAAANQAGQFYAGGQNAASLANQSAGLQGAQLGLQAAGQMGNLAQTGFNFGQQLGQQQSQQGLTQQAMMQQLIDAARNQWAGYAGAPSNALTLPMAAVGGANMGQNTTTSTQSQQPGLFNYLSLGASLL